MIPFNYHHLFYFYTIAKAGSMSKAAATLRVGQPALSTQLKTFEAYLGVELFERSKGKRLVLTQTGKHVIAYAEDIFRWGSEMVKTLPELKMAGAPLRVGTTGHVPKALVDEFLWFLYRESGESAFELVENDLDELGEMLALHEIDGVLCDTLKLKANQQAAIIGKIPMVIAAHPELAKRIKRFPKDLNGQPMILPTANSEIYASVREYLIEHRVEPRVIAEIQDVEVARRMALRKLGFAPLNRFTVDNAPSAEKLVPVHRVPLPFQRSVYLVTEKKKVPHPIIKKAIEQFRY